MKLLFLFLLLIPVCYTSTAQQNILDKRSKIKKRIEQYYQENNRRYSFTETKNTIRFVLNDSLSLPATYIYSFNENNRCEKEEIIYNCDSCMQKGVQESLSNKFINWKKVGTNSYYAGFPYNSLMEQEVIDGKHILRFTRMKRKDAKAFASEQ
jgi:hypothetical protein